MFAQILMCSASAIFALTLVLVFERKKSLNYELMISDINSLGEIHDRCRKLQYIQTEVDPKRQSFDSMEQVKVWHEKALQLLSESEYCVRSLLRYKTILQNMIKRLKLPFGVSSIETIELIRHLECVNIQFDQHVKFLKFVENLNEILPKIDDGMKLQTVCRIIAVCHKEI